jgi:pimeloyl-ACP methyl ester carboxylesterase
MEADFFGAFARLSTDCVHPRAYLRRTEEMYYNGLSVLVDNAEGSDTAAIVLPGFFEPKERPRYATLATALREAGISAIRFDPSGTGCSAGDVEDYTQTQYLSDVTSVVDVFAEQFNSVFSIGVCWGGLTALLHAASDSRVNGVVGLMPPRTFIWPSIFDAERAERWRNAGAHEFRYPATIYESISVPYRTVEDAVRYDLAEQATRLRVPTLIVAAEKDDVIPASSVVQVYGLLPEPKELQIIPDSGHEYPQGEINSKITAWLMGQIGRPSIL